MANEKIRILKIFYFLTKAQDYLTSRDIATLVGVSERTIKSDMEEVEEFALAAGAFVVAKKGKGYCIKVDDEGRFLAVRDQLEIHFDYSETNEVPYINRVSDILRLIVCENDYLSNDDIAEKLYLSRSTLRDDLKKAKDVLSSFNCKIKDFHEDGPMVVGSEFDKRLLMLCLFENHYHDAVTLYKDTNFLYWFRYDDERRKEIRRIFLKILRNSGCHVRDDHTQRMGRYLCLLNNRFNAGHKLIFNDEIKTSIKRFKEYDVARKVFEQCHSYDGLIIEESEIIGFAILLLFWADIPLNTTSCYYEYELLAEKFTLKCLQKMSKNHFFQLDKVKHAVPLITKVMIPIMIQHEFNVEKGNVQSKIISDSRIKLSPVSIYLALFISELYELEFHSSLSCYNVLSIASTIQVCMFNIKYSYKKQKAIVCMSNGLEYSGIVAKIIEKRFGQYFQCLDCYELYELREFTLQDYDCCIVGFPQFAYKYDWPAVHINMIPTHDQMNLIFNNLVLNGVEVGKALGMCGIDRLNIFKDFKFSNFDHFVDLISFKNGKNVQSCEKIKAVLYHQYLLLLQTEVSVLFIPHKLVNTTFMDIYSVKDDCNCIDLKAKKIVVISAKLNESSQALRFIHDLTLVIKNDVNLLEKLIANPTMKELENIVKQGLKMLPIALEQGK